MPGRLPSESDQGHPDHTRRTPPIKRLGRCHCFRLRRPTLRPTPRGAADGKSRPGVMCPPQAMDRRERTGPGETRRPLAWPITRGSQFGVLSEHFAGVRCVPCISRSVAQRGRRGETSGTARRRMAAASAVHLPPSDRLGSGPTRGVSIEAELRGEQRGAGIAQCVVLGRYGQMLQQSFGAPVHVGFSQKQFLLLHVDVEHVADDIAEHG